MPQLNYLNVHIIQNVWEAYSVLEKVYQKLRLNIMEQHPLLEDLTNVFKSGH